MEDLPQILLPVSAELLAAVPATLLEAEELARSIEMAIVHETAGSVRNLSVEVHDRDVLLRGSCATFYHKQLAQHAAMGVPGGGRLTNYIEVR